MRSGNQHVIIPIYVCIPLAVAGLCLVCILIPLTVSAPRSFVQHFVLVAKVLIVAVEKCNLRYKLLNWVEMTFICGVQSVALQYWLQNGEEGRDDPIIVSWFLLKRKKSEFLSKYCFWSSESRLNQISSASNMKWRRTIFNLNPRRTMRCGFIVDSTMMMMMRVEGAMNCVCCWWSIDGVY